jgi:site-specific DNA recombinase
MPCRCSGISDSVTVARSRLIHCAKCGDAMTIRTGKGGRYRYYTCSTKAWQGPTACTGMTVPMEKLDALVATHLEKRLLDPKRLEEVLPTVLDRRQERSERKQHHIAELNKRATETDLRLNRLYDAIEGGVANLDDPELKTRITTLKAPDATQIRQHRPRPDAPARRRLPPRPPARPGAAGRSQ